MEKEKALEFWDAIFGMNSYWQVDCFGTWMYRDDYGETEKTRIRPNGDGKKQLYGWEIDHIRPKSSFEDENDSNFLNNYEPMHWNNNREKADKYPHFVVNNRQYCVVKCVICRTNGFAGYGIIDEQGERIDWKGRMEKYFPTRK